MIESPSCHAEVLQHEIHKSSSSLHQRLGTAPTDLTQKIQQLIHGNTILTYYLRMSWLRKLSFLNELIKRIKSLDTMKLVIDTLQPLLGKLTSYCKSTTATPMNFDKVLNDHDRMFSSDILEENIALDLYWFESIEDQEQVAYLIAFIRLSGHALVRIFITNLQSALVQRLKIQALQSNHKDEKEEKKRKPESLSKHDLDDPKHQKCLQLQKTWEKTMGEYRRKVLRKKEEKASTKSKHKKGKNKKSKKQKKGKKSSKDEPLDWIQIMPIMIVKKIFNHLDKKSLIRAKKVNAYWKWAIGELLKDRQVRKSLNKSDKKLRKASGGERFFPESEFSEPKPRVSHTERRLQKLQMRGAILEELRQNSRVAENTNALVTEALKTFSEFAPYVSDLTMYPRVERKNSPIYKRPAFIVKDLGIICEERDELSESEEDSGRQDTHMSSSVASSGSDRF